MQGIIAWFIKNPIAANLLMLMILISGIAGLPDLNKEFFPAVNSNVIEIYVPYRGAGPREVEENISVRIEDAIHDLDGIDKIRSTARQGVGITLVEVASEVDSQYLLNKIKNRVDALTTLPAESEKPQIKEVVYSEPVLRLTLSGDASETTLKQYGEKIRNEMASLPHVSKVELKSTRPYEVSVEISEQTLRRYGLQFDQVVNSIRNQSLNLPAGAIRAEAGSIKLQTRGQAYTEGDFEDVVILRNSDGVLVRLGDIATVINGFEQIDSETHYNGKPAVFFRVLSINNPDILKTSESVQKYVEESAYNLPDGLTLSIWTDASFSFKGRIKTLVSNGIGGLVLVFLVLMLFLRPLLAVWVCVGIAVSFLGTLWLLPYTGISLNMLSLFAFLLILGIVVDDAIVVSESIYSRQQSGLVGDEGANVGVQSVYKPIMYAVISTMIAFVPMFFLVGDSADAAKSIPVVVLLTLTFSLVECLLILPSHLSKLRPIQAPTNGASKLFERARQACANGMEHFSTNFYRPILKKSLHWHWFTLAGFICVLMISFSIPAGGWLRMSFTPEVTSDQLKIRVVLPEGSPFSDTENLMKKIENAALRLQDEYRFPAVGESAGGSYISNILAWSNENTFSVLIALNRERRSEISAKKMITQWREYVGEIPSVESFDMAYTLNSTGKALQFVLSGPDKDALANVTNELKALLSRYPGVYDITDSMQTPRLEIELNLKPNAQTLEVELADIAAQVRQGFYGAEVQRIPLENEDVRVMVRYPKDERESADYLHNMWIRTKSGLEVPFDTVAEVSYVPSYQKIERIDRQRTLTVNAGMNNAEGDASKTVSAIMKEHAHGWQAQYPGLHISLEGEQKETGEFIDSLLVKVGQAILVIYALFAIAFRSYWQPVIILTAIPFGLMGAIVGHLVMGCDVSIFSMLGVVACTGVVINDNLVLIDRINQLRDSGVEITEALLQAGQDRFRPIVLTSITTFIGLVPIMLETSLQAQFLIPMVTSLAFGVLMATSVTLLLVPTLYLMGERVRAVVAIRKNGVYG